MVGANRVNHATQPQAHLQARLMQRHLQPLNIHRILNRTFPDLFGRDRRAFRQQIANTFPFSDQFEQFQHSFHAAEFDFEAAGIFQR